MKQKGIIAWFASHPVAANLLMACVLLAGFWASGQLRKEAFPAMEPSEINISVTYESGSPTQAEEGIAIKIEQALENVAGIKRITSTSTATGAVVKVEKRSAYSLDTLFEEVKTKVDAIYNMPADAQNPVIEKASRQEHALWIQIYGETSRASLTEVARQLKSALLATSAISKVELEGAYTPMLSVELDEARLAAFNLSIQEVSAHIDGYSSQTQNAELRAGSKTLRLDSSNQVYDVDALMQSPIITTTSGAVVSLGDIATVTEVPLDESLLMSRFNQQSAVALEVLMSDSSDITQVVASARQVVEAQKLSLPLGVSLATWYDKSTLISERLQLLIKNALTGIALVFIVLALFLNLRLAFWVSAGLPFVFCGTLYLMTDSYLSLTLNEMTTFGFIMALGIVVDDAVVVGESIYTHRQRLGDNLSSTIKGTHAVAAPTIFGVLTTVAAFVALSQVEGGLGTLYAQFGGIVAICLLLSLVESKLILPSHLAHLNTRPAKPQSAPAQLWNRMQGAANAGLDWLNERLYRPLLSQMLSHRYASLLIFVSILVLSLSLPLSGKVKLSFFPSIPNAVIKAEMSLVDDASPGQTTQNLNWLEQTAMEADKVLMGHYQETGSGIASLQLLAQDDLSGSLALELSPSSPYQATEFIQEWKTRAGTLEATRKLKIQANFEPLDSFKLELKGWDSDTLIAAAKQVDKALRDIKGVSGIDHNIGQGQAQYKLTLTREGVALGFSYASLGRQVLEVFGGDTLQRFQRNQDEIKLKVRYPLAQRQHLSQLYQTRIKAPNGARVPLMQIAQIEALNTPDEITRINGQRAITLTAAVDKAQLSPAELIQTLRRGVLASIAKTSPDIQMHFAGEAEQEAETTQSMGSMFLVALGAIYLLLAIALGGYVQPVIIMLAIPFGIVGAILGHWFHGLALSILSLNGILALSGVVVNDSLLLASRFNQLRGKLGLEQAIVDACSSRLRAVLLTSITTFAGLAPLLSESSLQAQFLIPAAASLGYGILFATAITLLFIPLLLAIHQDLKAQLKRLSAKLKTSQEAATC